MVKWRYKFCAGILLASMLGLQMQGTALAAEYALPDGYLEDEYSYANDAADGEYEDVPEIIEENFYEDDDNAEGGIIPVVGFEISEENRYVSEEQLVGDGVLPESYIPQVRTVIGEQGSRNTCWAYAAMTCAERDLIGAGITDSLNLSEKHLLYGYYNREGDSGIPASKSYWYNTTGSLYMPVAAMAEYLGAADENAYPYNYDAITEDQYTDDVAHLEEALFLPGYPTDPLDWKGELWDEVTREIKAAVMTNGAVWISAYSLDKHNTVEWYTPWPYTESDDGEGGVIRKYGEKPGVDHALTIVGWDDAKEIPGAENPGAFYVQNSWGESYGEEGYCWISYEDASLASPVSYSMEKSPLGKMRNHIAFSHTGTGWYGKGLILKGASYGVNVFTPEHYVYIDQAGFYTSGPWNYEIELITDISDSADPASGTVAATASGKAAGSGFHKADFDTAVEVRAGEAFAVKVTQYNEDKTRYYVAFEGATSDKRRIFCNEGESYLYVQKSNLCLDCSKDSPALGSGVNLGANYHSPCIYAYGSVETNMFITGDVSEAEIGNSFALTASYGPLWAETEVVPNWYSMTDGVSVTEEGLVTVEAGALTGEATIIAEYSELSAAYRFDVLADAAEEDLSGVKMLGTPCCPFVAGPEDAGDSEGAGVITRKESNDGTLCYLFEKEGDRYYKIENFYSGLVLTAAEDDGMGSRYVSQASWDGGDEQLWRVLKVEGGCILRNKDSGTCLEISEFTEEEGDFLVTAGTDLKNASYWEILDGRANLADAAMTLPVSAACTGSAVKPAVTLAYGCRTLAEGTDYKLKFANNVKPGTATVTATGIGAMTGSRAGTFVLVNSAASVKSGKNYMIVPVKGPTKAVTVEKGSMLPKSRIYLSAQQDSEAQKFIFTKNSDGTYTLTDQKSDFVAGIRNNSTANASSLETQQDAGTSFQRWNLKKQSDGSYSILNAKTGKAVYLVGGKVAAGTYIAQYNYSGSINQRFYLVEATATAHTYSHTYTVRAAGKTSLALEISGASLQSGANARLYTYSGGASQKFRLMYSGGGYYRIVNVNSGKVLGIKDDSKENGANVRQATWNASSGQRWKVLKQSDGSLVLKSALGTALDIYAGSLKAATNVDSWAVNYSKAQRWKLVKVS
ncbi:MAG: RICIN domain-containing protein [Lachnospiraceae bacterium]|nr:RICIN domain-containing protein [Lachnospiraceae bacterium]